MTKKGFIKSAALLGAAGIMVKIIGILYRIPLANILGTEGSALYSTAYPFYTILLMLSTAGLPPVISKLVSEHIALGDKAGAKKVYRVSLVLLAVLGIICSLILFFFAKQFALLVEDPLAETPIKFIAPAIFFVAIMAAVRGYFQGMQNMFPTAMTQLVEQVIKVVFGLLFAYLMAPMGIEYGAAGAILGVVLSEFVALCVIIVYYFAKRDKTIAEAASAESIKSILVKILKLAFPILLGASIMPLVNLMDTTIIRARLMDIGYPLEMGKNIDSNSVAEAGKKIMHPNESARSLYGMFSFYVNTLVNVPGTISLAFCVSILPVIASSYAKGDKDEVAKNAKMGFKMAMLIGIPSAVGLAVLAEPIMRLLYGSKLTPDQLELSGNLLMVLAGGVIFLSILQTLNGVLQGLGKVMVPVIALSIGAAVKVILVYTLIGVPEINIYGAPISTFSCYLIAALIDIGMVKRFTGVRFGLIECVIRPALASLCMGAAAWVSHHYLVSIIGNVMATIIAVFVGIMIFVVCIPIFQVMKRTEILAIPGGTKVIKMYDLLSWGKKNG